MYFCCGFRYNCYIVLARQNWCKNADQLVIPIFIHLKYLLFLSLEIARFFHSELFFMLWSSYYSGNYLFQHIPICVTHFPECACYIVQHAHDDASVQITMGSSVKYVKGNKQWDFKGNKLYLIFNVHFQIHILKSKAWNIQFPSPIIEYLFLHCLQRTGFIWITMIFWRRKFLWSDSIFVKKLTVYPIETGLT